MKTKGYLIVGKNGSLNVVKSFRSNSSIDPDSVAIELNITLPDSVFKPTIQATINIDEKDVTPLLIKAGKLNKTAEIISNEIGMKVVLKSVEVEKKTKGNKS